MNLTVIKNNEVRVLTSQQLADSYETEVQVITNNFNRNKSKYIEGKHYIALKGTEKSEFIKKNQNEFSSFSKAKAIYLWTEKGALLHAKSLNTDKAWEVYDYLVDHYFRTQEKQPEQPKPRPNTITVVDVPDNPQILEGIQKIQDDLTAMNVLLRDCKKYLDEKTYKDRVETICGVLHILVGDVSRFRDLRPKMVERYY